MTKDLTYKWTPVDIKTIDLLKEIRNLLATHLPILNGSSEVKNLQEQIVLTNSENDRLRQKVGTVEVERLRKENSEIARRLHVQLMESERLSKENADLRAELDSVTRREAEGVALFDKLLADERAKVANLQNSVNELCHTGVGSLRYTLKAEDKPGRWVLFCAMAKYRPWCDKNGWHPKASDCESPWRTKAEAENGLVIGDVAINLDDHKETHDAK